MCAAFPRVCSAKNANTHTPRVELGLDTLNFLLRFSPVFGKMLRKKKEMLTRALLRSTLVAAVARHRHRHHHRGFFSSSFRRVSGNSRAFGNNTQRRRRRRQTTSTMRSSSFSDDANAVTSNNNDNNDNEEKKRSLRAKIKSRLKTHASREEELRDSEVICEKIMGMRAYREAKTMCVYIAHPKLHEVDCSRLIREALSSSSSEREKEEEEKKVYVPIVDDRNSNVRFLRIWDLEKDLEKRTMGIMEPTETDWRTNERREDLADLKDDERLDLVITPGLAFDETCKRLGRGGGYYDKFLREGKGREAVKIGLAYDAQIVDGEAEDEAIPLDPWDVVLDVVVSKSRDFYREKVEDANFRT